MLKRLGLAPLTWKIGPLEFAVPDPSLLRLRVPPRLRSLGALDSDLCWRWHHDPGLCWEYL